MIDDSKILEQFETTTDGPIYKRQNSIGLADPEVQDNN